MRSRSIKAYILRMAVMLFAGFTTCSSVWAQHAPNSSFDVCTGYGGYINVQGWAYDQDVPDKSISMRVDIYTNSSCDDLYKSVTIKAIFYRSDLGAARGFRKNIDINDAGDYWVKVTALDETGDANTVRGPKTATVTGYTEINGSNMPTTWNTGTYKVTEDVTYPSYQVPNRIIVNGDVMLWLGEGTTLTVCDGITVDQSNKLTIDGTGSLVSSSTHHYHAGIGTEWANGAYPYGEIVINNGNITATGGSEAAGIGGGWIDDDKLGPSTSKITINGGVVTATGGSGGAAAIGGGFAYWNYDYHYGYHADYNEYDGLGGTIVINGGQVTAISTDPTVYSIGRGMYATGTEGSSVSLGWTDPTDFIHFTRLDPNNLSIRDGRSFTIEGSYTLANSENISQRSNVTIRPAIKSLESAIVDGIYDKYTYRAEDFMPQYTVTDAFGDELTLGVDYNATLTLSGNSTATLNAVGHYTLTLTGTGQYSGTRIFDIDVLDFSVPTNLRQTAYKSNSATLGWTIVGGLSEYTLQYSTDKNFATYTSLELNDSIVTIDGLVNDDIYYARIKAHQGSAFSDWSDTVRFEPTDKTWYGMNREEEFASPGIPSGNLSSSTHTEQIYTPTEIGRKGFLSSLTVYMDFMIQNKDYCDEHGYTSYTDFIEDNNKNQFRVIEEYWDIYIVYTDSTKFNIEFPNDKMGRWMANGTPFTLSDKVFSGYVYFTPDAWNTIKFNKTFEYDGNKNIVIIIEKSHTTRNKLTPEPCFLRQLICDSFQSIGFVINSANHEGDGPFTIDGGPIVDAVEISGFPHMYHWLIYNSRKDEIFDYNPIKTSFRFGFQDLDFADQTNNNSELSNNNNLLSNVTLTDRTLYCDGNWNTLCLPFDIDDLDGTIFEDATLKELNPATSNLNGDDVLTLNFTDANSIEAGKPYIVKWTPGTMHIDGQGRCIINSTADWNAFVAEVSNGNNQLNAILAADISVSTMIGTSSNMYSGTFDGNGHTLSFSQGTALEPYNTSYCGLFQYINGATIKNLHVTGNIYTSKYHAGGLIGWASGGCLIEHCHISTIINGYKDGYEFEMGHGGIIGGVDNNSIIINNCRFDGQILGANICESKGFVGNCGLDVTISRSLFTPEAISVLPDLSATFISMANATINQCYYTQALGLPQGTDASGMSSNELATALGSQWTVINGKAVPRLITEDINIIDPIFKNITINGDLPTPVSFEGGKFIGTYSPFADTSARLIGNRNEGNRGFRAAISLDGYTVDWYLNEERTIPATTIPFDPSTGQVVLYLDKTKNTAELEALNNGSSVEELETNWANKTVEVSFTRSFTQNVASTICLPYPMTEIPAGGSVYEFVDVQKEAGVWVATMRDATPANKVNATVVGKPYLFMPSATGEVIFSGSVEVPENVTAGSSTSDANDGTWTFRGTYRRLAYMADGSADLDGSVFGFASTSKEVDGNMVNAGEFVRAKDGAGVPAFRAFLTYDGTNNAFRAPSRSSATDSGSEIPDRIMVRLLGKNGTVTAVGTMNTATGDVKIEQWFDIQGRPVDGTPAVPGMYINNSGSKVMIK